MSSLSTAQPHWHQPVKSADAPVLKMNNSMTHSKTEFVPAIGNLVNWYTCGPTVYDKSHLGHARNYITFDIIRRIMEDYFNYDVNFVMNITDIDDKIIITARSTHLFNQKKESTPSLSVDLISDIQLAFAEFVASKLGKYLVASANGAVTDESFAALVQTFEEGKGPSFQDEPKFAMWMRAAIRANSALTAARKTLASNPTASKPASDLLLDETREVYAPYLDARLKHTVTDHAIFRDFARYWELDYFKDMDALNIRRPDVITRVSEYVPEIVTFVEQIIKNGYAYESDGSIYFNTRHFDSHPSHFYAKLEPWSASNLKLMQEGEGDLSSSTTATTKKSPADFALWKSSKPGEPAWSSPWGMGRPGWHIECSAMAGDVLGDKMDIHSGGIDLAFPHHDNELAQSEAHYNCAQWVNYFLHAGHLHASGQKMSKSLKNFDTISTALETHTAAQLRILFLLHSWDTVLDYKPASLTEAKNVEQVVNKFLATVKAVVAEEKAKPVVLTGAHGYRSLEKELMRVFQAKQGELHAALCDNFDTVTAMTVLRDLISATNVYLKQSAGAPNTDVLVKVGRYVTRMMRVFGVYADANPDLGEGASAGAVGGASVEEVAGPYVRLMASFRDKVRDLARRTKDSDMLKLCDTLRDDELVELNVALDDREEGKPALVKFVAKEEILGQREEKRVAAVKAAEEKERKRAEVARVEAERLAKGRVVPGEMFKDEEGRKVWGAWDDKGIPIKKIDGEEVSKGGAKKLVKMYEAQVKLHEKYLASLKQ
ncbi:hypothetical protein HDU98_001551 [Podochytrium sp. JEL0797]|nr:hypothetical protein HDU98_001551 [Podochytrium sp. JEL0797]